MYRATKTLFMRGKPIKPGQTVPADYPPKDLQLAIKRGWVEPAGAPAVKSQAPPPAQSPKAPRTRKPPKKVIKDRQPKVARKTTRELETEVPDNEPDPDIVDGDEGEVKVPDTPPIPLTDLIFLGDLARQSLDEMGIETVADLKGWDEERLIELPGIGVATARRLMEAAGSASPADDEGA